MLLKHYSLEAYVIGGGKYVTFSRFSKRQLDNGKTEIYDKQVEFNIPVDVASDKGEDIINAGLLRAVEYLLNDDNYAQLKAVMDYMSANSAVMFKAFVPNTYGLNTKFNFSSVPAMIPEVLFIAARVEQEFTKQQYLYEDECHYCDSLSTVVKCQFGHGYCMDHYAQLINTGVGYEVPRCSIENCAGHVPIASKHGISGLHWTYPAGHSPEALAKLVAYFNQDFVMKDFEVEDHYAMLRDIISNVSDRMFPGVKKHSLAPIDFSDINMVRSLFPHSGIGLFRETLGRPFKKDEIRELVCSTIMDCFQRCTILKDGDAMIEVRKLMTSIVQTAVKLEDRAAEFGPDGWEFAPGERLFSVEDAILFALFKAVFAPFANCGGFGTFGQNQPNSIGITFAGDSAARFLKEITGNKFPMPKDVNGFVEWQTKVAEHFWILEWDWSKWDILVSSTIIQLAMRQIFSRFDLDFENKFSPDSHDYHVVRFFRFVLWRMLEIVVVKIMTSPCGTDYYYVLNGMSSGRYITAIINTMVNNVITDFILADIYGLSKVFKSQRKGEYNSKFFGDDVLALLSKSQFPEFSPDKFIVRAKKFFGMLVKPENFKICERIFVDTTLRQDKFSPTFLKMQFNLVQCPLCEAPHVCWYRNSDLIVPKLFTNSKKSTTVEDLVQKMFCVGWTLGCNYDVYKVCRFTVDYLKVQDNSEYDEENARKLLTHGLDLPFTRFPSYADVVYYNSCPTSVGTHIKIRTFVPWNQYVLAGEEFFADE